LAILSNPFEMNDFTKRCLVCGCEVDPETATINSRMNLPVCDDCSGTDREKKAIDELLDGMAEGFVCGCI
jgi:ribosome-binding protein aMBF1 (putative translation factor)